MDVSARVAPARASPPRVGPPGRELVNAIVNYLERLVHPLAGGEATLSVRRAGGVVGDGGHRAFADAAGGLLEIVVGELARLGARILLVVLAHGVPPWRRLYHRSGGKPSSINPSDGRRRRRQVTARSR